MKMLLPVLLFCLLVFGAHTARTEPLHRPHGNNELYGSREAERVLWDRQPHDPVEGEAVTLYAALDGIDRQREMSLLWSLNGEEQTDIACSRYMEKNGKTVFRARLPAFLQGDKVLYRFASSGQSSGEYAFTVLGWFRGGARTQAGGKGTVRLTLDGTEGELPGRIQGIRYLSDGSGYLHACEITLSARPDDRYLGFGMRYNAQDQRGQVIDHYTVNWYGGQGEKTYASVPFYLCAGRYGLWADTDSYVRFDMAKSHGDKVIICIELQGKPRDIYLFEGNNAEISTQYAKLAGTAETLPAWAWGVWLSANEWNNQDETMEQLDLAQEHGIPVSVLVLEAWSDELTFYRFSERFPDPKAMIDAAHEQDTRVLLWQIPVLKAAAQGNELSRSDEREAVKNHYVIMNADGTPYHMPDGWFGRSMLVDFTNPDAAAWFFSKRQYLVDELGVDGFKTDGGEFVWGMEAASFSGLRGRELRNTYPDDYALGYQQALDTLTFSRAAGRRANSHSLIWAGDQYSTFDEFRACVNAVLSMNVSGMPYVTFDIAGFAGELPSAELYQRAVAFAAFTPVMQVHSEASGDPAPSQARTPWNMAERKNDGMCLTTFRKYADVNKALRPYMMEQAEQIRHSGLPLLRPMAYAWPEDQEAHRAAYQFMLGERYLVAPVVKPRVTEWPVYLPHGLWRDYFSGEVVEGGRWVTCSAQVDEIPVFEIIGN